MISLGALLGGGFTLLVLGWAITHICYPIQWRTPGVWLATSLLGIPALLVGASLVAKFPALLVLALIAAFAGDQFRKR